MRNVLARIGIAILLLTVAPSLIHTAYAMESTSYRMQADIMDGAVGGGASTNFVLDEAAMTWTAKPLASTSYTLLPTLSYDSQSSASSVATPSSGAGASNRPSTNRRPRVPSSPSTSSVSSVSSSSSVSSDSSVSSPSSSSSDSSQPSTSSVSSDSSVSSPSSVSSVSSVSSPSTNWPSCLDTKRACIADDTLHDAAGTPPETPWLALLIATMILLASWRESAYRTAKRRRSVTALLLLMTLSFSIVQAGVPITALAAQTTPDTSVYNGRLLSAAGTPITTAVSVRFSYWTSADAVAGDTNGDGTINTGAATYGGWQETHVITPNANGYFSVTLGSSTALPDFASMQTSTLLSLYLQVDVKPSAAAETSYEILDVDGTDPTVDRAGILSVPFSRNADMIDQREIGTASGSIALLGSGGVYPVGMIPGGTNAGSFTIDADSSEASTVTLVFGATLSKTLSYSVSAGAFIFNDDVEVQGNLTVSGLINGVDVTSLGSSTGALRATDGGGLTLRVSHGEYRLGDDSVSFAGDTIAMTQSATNYVFFGSGGLQKNLTGFPTDESVIPVAQVTTSADDILSITDRRILQSDTREQSITLTFTPAFDKTAFQGDGSNNVGQLSLQHDDINRRSYYLWTSTQSTLQDYDLLVHIPLPANFARWADTTDGNPVALSYRTTSASNAASAIDLQVTDTNGVPVTLSGSVTGLASTSWASREAEWTGSPTWTAGQEMMVRLRGFAKSSEQAHIGSLTLRYVTFGR